MRYLHLLKLALFGVPLRELTGKGMIFIRRVFKARQESFVKNRTCTYPDRPVQQGDFERFVPEIPAALLEPLAPVIAVACGNYLEHRFDLLGSGWVKIHHGMECAGVEGHRYAAGGVVIDRTNIERLIQRLTPGNRQRATAIWQMVGEGYRPIDWQIDFKSGYRWSEGDWWRDIKYGHLPGVDVKVPWEIGRLQHLIHLAWAFNMAKAGRGGFTDPEGYADEFRNQVLDFWGSNPPGYGASWACPMDVAIRAANLAVSLDLFRRHGAEFDAPFLEECAAMLEAHGRHVVDNLEWHDHHRANHYLSDIVGLLFVAAYLPSNPERDCWLAFSVQQLVLEFERQFTDDGANFEASTCYHRLCSEMITYGTALILGLSEEKRRALGDYDVALWPHQQPPLQIPGGEAKETADAGSSLLPEWWGERLERAAEFIVDVTKPNGRVVQIGDNDSGRFFKATPLLDEADGRWEEVHLDHRATAAAINGLFGRDDLTEFAGPECAVESLLVRGIAGEGQFSPRQRTGEGATGFVHGDADRAGNLALLREISIELPDPTVFDGLRAWSYPDFGLFGWSSERLFLSIRCGPVGQNGNGGHAHNDQLAIEINVDGEDWIADPGTYLYTSAPEKRNAYRSVKVHAAPVVPGGEEPCTITPLLFRLDDQAFPQCVCFDESRFVGSHVGFGAPLYRSVSIEAPCIVVRDHWAGAAAPETILRVTTPTAARAAFIQQAEKFSPGYGLLDGDAGS